MPTCLLKIFERLFTQRHSHLVATLWGILYHEVVKGSQSCRDLISTGRLGHGAALRCCKADIMECYLTNTRKLCSGTVAHVITKVICRRLPQIRAVPIVCNGQITTNIPQSPPPAIAGSVPLWNTAWFGFPQVSTPNRTSIRSAVFAKCSHMTVKQTYWLRY